MTVNELIAWLNEHEISGDDKIRIHAFGGLRGGKDVDRISVGFDWDHGSIVLHTKQQLSICKEKVKDGE